MVAFISFVKRVFTEISMGVMVIFFQGARNTMRAASGSNHQLNSRRASMAPGSMAPLSAYKSATHHHEFFRQRGDGWIQLQRQCKIGKRPAGPKHDLARIFVHHLYDELCRGACGGLDVRFSFRHGWHDVGRVVRLSKTVERLALNLSVQQPLYSNLPYSASQRSVSSLELSNGNSAPCDDGNVGAIGDLQQAQDMLRLFLDPLIAADSRDPEYVKFLGLQEHQDGLLIAGARPAGVLVDDDFDLLG